MIPPDAEQFAESLMYDDWAKQNPEKKTNGGRIGKEGEPALIRFKSFAEFCQEYEPLAYTIEPLLRTSSLYTLTARTGHGKTALLVIIALAIATGRKDIIRLDVSKGRVGFLTFENPDDVRMRFMIAAYALNILPSEINSRIMVLDARMKPELVYAGLDRLAKDDPFSLVIVDTFAAFFDGDNTNDATQGGEFMRRMRPFTKIEGKPTTLIAAHPIKNAPEDNLLPYGSGAILNEVDGNLTLWKNPNTGIVSLYWQGKLRGLDFDPIPFRFESLSSPDLLDIKGRQFLLPVLRPCDAIMAEQREKAESEVDKALIKAMADNPDGSQADWGAAIGKPKGTVNRRLQGLKRLKLVEEGLGKWILTPKGLKEAANT